MRQFPPRQDEKQAKPIVGPARDKVSFAVKLRGIENSQTIEAGIERVDGMTTQAERPGVGDRENRERATASRAHQNEGFAVDNDGFQRGGVVDPEALFLTNAAFRRQGS